MNTILQIICIFVFIGIVIGSFVGTVLITLVSIFVYNKWQTVLNLKQDLYNLENFVLDCEFDIAILEGEINDIQTTIDENAMRILRGTNNYNIELANATNECDINLLTEQINAKTIEIIGLQREILSIKYNIDNWLM